MPQTAPDDSLARRALLTGGAALALLSTAAPAAAAPANPAEQLRMYMLMRGALDDRLLVSFIECNYWGIVNADMTPFYNLVAATFSRCRPAPGGGYDVVSFEVEYFLNRDTGLILQEWQNPYTGKTVLAKHADSVPVKYKIGPDCQIITPPKPLFPGAVISHATLPLRVIGGDVWSTETATARVPVPGGKPVFYNEKIINHARLSDLQQPGAKHVKTDVTYTGITSFRPWQEMADNQPGEMLGLGHGAVGLEARDLPATWIAATKIHRPDALTNPGAYLDPLWKSLT